MLPALAPYFREETAFARKEALYMRVISYFERSKEWEQAIELCRSLVVQYENDFADNLKVCMRGQGGGARSVRADAAVDGAAPWARV